MLAAKRLFARRGFHNTSISDIKKDTGLPVGSIYTYFNSKDDILLSLIAEGWQALYEKVNAGFSTASSLDARIKILTEVFFTDLVRDTDLIAILLTEAIELTGIAEKLDLLMELVIQLLPQTPSGKTVTGELDLVQLRTAVVVYFLGFLNAARLSRAANFGISITDVQAFMEQLIAGSLGYLGVSSQADVPQ